MYFHINHHTNQVLFIYFFEKLIDICKYRYTNIIGFYCQDFSPEQLEDMTTNQVHAITSMQRSFMSKDQMAAIGIVNGLYTKHFKIT